MRNKLLLGVLAMVMGWGSLQADEAAVRAALAKALPDLKPDAVTPAPMPGLYEVRVGSNLVYLSEDGRYLLQGDLIDLEKRENLTENRQEGIRADALKGLSEDKMVIFAPASYQHTITVFTDIDCGYCRKLHKEINDYLQAGIRVRYLFFPRAGQGSPTFDKSVAVWCASDRQKAMTDAKAGKDIEMKTCPNPIEEHMALAQQFGVNGTPTLVLEDGRVMPGYAPAKYLATVLDGGKTN